MAYMVCFIAAKDSRVSISKFSFFVFSVLIVTGLGVANEIIEFIGQNYFHYLFAPHINDTWLDLISNTVGIAVGSACFVPFANFRKNQRET
ncbi:hypothetical protein FJZ48_02295 [Candidatus Uhrbacteria bacterium]|nr:hypothetical protein [Candidatus Uhrbacteria bacterium]